MNGLAQAAGWVRDLLARQAWLDGWQSTIAATPDWALLALGPGFFLLLAVFLWAQAPRGRRRAGDARPDAPPSKQQGDEKAHAAAAPTVAVGVVAACRGREASQSPAPAATTARARLEDAITETKAVASLPARRASGVPAENEQERRARVFLSSTFRDMRDEREVLATETFPTLKRKFRARGVEVHEVDLRWGVNEGDPTLKNCLDAVRGCPNWFVGIVGQCYGTTLDDRAIVEQLAVDYPCVRDGCGADFVARAMSLVWASRAGLEEDEIIAIVAQARDETIGKTGLDWERLRNRLAGNLRDSQGRIAFRHDYLRRAVEKAYLETDAAKRAAHLAIANRFETHEDDVRRAEELPHQLKSAEAWARLELVLLDCSHLPRLIARGYADYLSYWRPLKNSGRELEVLICRAFENHFDQIGKDSGDESYLALELCNVLDVEGLTGDLRMGLQRRAVVAAEHACGSDHHNVAITLISLADLYISLHRYNEALPVVERALSIAETSGRHLDAALSRFATLAVLTGGGWSEAEPILRRALAVAESSFGPGNRKVAIRLISAAEMLFRTERVPEAELFLARALSIVESLSGIDPGEELGVILKLVRVQRAQGKIEEALAVMTRAKAKYAPALSAEGLLAANFYNEWSGCLFVAAMDASSSPVASSRVQEWLVEAEQAVCKAISIRERDVGHLDHALATYLTNLGSLLVVCGRSREAYAAASRARDILESLSTDKEMAEDLNNLGIVLLAVGQNDQAASVFARAEKIARIMLGAESRLTRTIVRNLANCSANLSDAD